MCRSGDREGADFMASWHKISSHGKRTRQKPFSQQAKCERISTCIKGLFRFLDWDDQEHL